MSIYSDRVSRRNETEEQRLTDSLNGMMGTLLGKHYSEGLNDCQIVQSAVDEIIRFFHCKVSPDEIPGSVTGFDDILEYKLRPHGIVKRHIKLEPGWHRDAVGPMLARLVEDNRVVALIPGKFGGYVLSDISEGKRVRINAKTEKLIGEDAVCFYASLPQRKLTVADLLTFMLKQLSGIDVAMIFILMGISTLIGMIYPAITRALFGPVLESGMLRGLIAISISLIAYSICKICFSAYHTLIEERIGTKQNVAVEAAVMARILSLPASFFKEMSAGEMSQRSQYVQRLCSTLFNFVTRTGLTAVFSLAYIAQVLHYAPTLVIPALLTTLCSIGLSLWVSFAQMKNTRDKMLLSTKVSGLEYSMLTGIQKIKLVNAERRMFTRWLNTYRKYADKEYNPPLLVKQNATFSLAITLTGTIVMYFIAVKSKVAVADYYAFTSAYAMVTSALLSLSSMVTSIAGIRPTLEMAKLILDVEPENAVGKEFVTELDGNIELSHVSFRYSDDMPMFIDDLSLTVKRGEYLAVVGSTGCGKSTLLRLLLGFETPIRGRIYYDHKDMHSLDLKSLRRRMGVVMQNDKLFNGDILSNITIAAPNATLDDAFDAAEKAAIADDIRSMPMGMFTYISEGQGGISGGQRQRLIIARALIGKPSILFFDEATSALDNLTQKKVSDAIDKLNCTRIVIAHRLSTIRNADRIVYLDHGKIAEEGTYEELIAKNGMFAELVERQRLDI